VIRRRPRILVRGAGLAGLTAAKLLRDRGVDIRMAAAPRARGRIVAIPIETLRLAAELHELDVAALTTGPMVARRAVDWSAEGASVVPQAAMICDVADLAALTAVGLNERLRYYRYAGGERFAPHVDLSHSDDVARSFLTIIFYLNDGFTGGETDFFGRSVTPRLLTLEALWYGALRSQLIRIVVVRDPSGRRRDEAFFCTDLERDAAFILETYSRRWTLEVTQPHCPHRSPEPLGCVVPAACVERRLELPLTRTRVAALRAGRGLAMQHGALEKESNCEARPGGPTHDARTCQRPHSGAGCCPSRDECAHRAHLRAAWPATQPAQTAAAVSNTA